MAKSKKLYMVRVGANGESRIVIADAAPAKFMGIACIKGTHRHKENYWTEGTTIYIPTANILDVVEFDSLADYRSRLKRHYERQAE